MRGNAVSFAPGEGWDSDSRPAGASPIEVWTLSAL